jgi:transcriptional regulator GlxA family with amidase domain
MTLFRRQFGISLTSYLTQYRVSHAQRLLATTDDSVLQIALASGIWFSESLLRCIQAHLRTVAGAIRASLSRAGF